MNLAEFDFDLPAERIALRPAAPRDASRLLEVSADGSLRDRRFADLPGRLRAGDALVFNDTRVIAARLRGVRERDGAVCRVEANLGQRIDDGRWTAFMRPGKRLRSGDRLRFGEGGDRACALGSLDATVEAKGEDGEVTLAFDLAGPDLDLAIEDRGAMPLPPYIAARRPVDERDRRDYQTIHARDRGSVAAPTAGLHFTDEIFGALGAAGVSVHFVTLHVGAGTFLPVKAERAEHHRMHAEWGRVSADVAGRLNAVRGRGGRIVCVGTTSLRLLESAADGTGQLAPFAGETAIFIRPGYRFRVADGLVTNFHLPRSTLLMLVAAFSGLETIRAAYAHAIADGYRFYSYGDACLLWRRL